LSVYLISEQRSRRGANSLFDRWFALDDPSAALVRLFPNVKI